MLKRLRNLILFTGVSLFVALLIVGSYLSYQQAVVLVHPPQYRLPPPPAALDSVRDVTFITEDNLTLRGWFAPPATTPGAAVLFVHGHGGSRAQFDDEAVLVASMGYGVLVFDLRNHGTSEGERTTMGLYEVRDVRAAFEFIIAQPEIDPDRVVIYGQSMGGATAIQATAQLPRVRGLIVDTAYTTLPAVISDGVTTLSGLPPFPWAQMTVAFAETMSDVDMSAVRPIDAVGQIAPRPILFLHGTADNTIRPAHSRELYAAAGEPKTLVIVEGGGHGNLYDVAPAVFEAEVLNLLSAALGE